jgi:hypothetical protein
MAPQPIGIAKNGLKDAPPRQTRDIAIVSMSRISGTTRVNASAFESC